MDDRNSPATKGDLEGIESRLGDRMAGLDERMTGLDERMTGLDERMEMLRSETSHSHNEIMEAFRDGQTELLKAFYNYSQTSDERMGLAENETASFKKRLAILESRVKEVEKRLNMPPAA
jgi:chromosome segregation ATPase